MKKIVFITVPVLIIAILGVGSYMVFLRKDISVGEFNLQDYDYFIENFPSEKVLGPVNSAEEALEKAESVWIDTFGERVEKKKPYKVFYDQENKVWLVRGSLPKKRMLGGVPHIIIRPSDGKVLALWHTK